MKKLFFAAALFLATGTAAWAAQDATMKPAVQAAADETFTPIDVKELPAKVLESVDKNYPEATVTAAAEKSDSVGVKTYRVVLTDRDGAERTVFFSEAGDLLPAGDSEAASDTVEAPCDEAVLD